MRNSPKKAKDLVVFLCAADEKENGGEAEYARALAQEISAAPKSDTVYLFFRTGPAAGEDLSAAPMVRAATPPVHKEDYAKIPVMPAQDMVFSDAASLKIIGLGNSTFAALSACAAAHTAKADVPVDASFVTHIVDKKDVKAIVEQRIRTFGTQDREAVASDDPSVNVAALRYVRLDQVPKEKLRKDFAQAAGNPDFDRFLASPSGAETREILEGGKPYAIKILDAGFAVPQADGSKTFVPHTQDEAFENGYALGRFVSAGTDLVLIHGGPRNVVNENPNPANPEHAHAPQKTTSYFQAGYLLAQHEQRGSARIAVEPTGTGYNLTNCIPELVAKGDTPEGPRCQIVVSNSEGFGTMAKLAETVDNTRVPLALQHMAANDLEASRVAQLDKNLTIHGFQKLEKVGGDVVLTSRRGRANTPIVLRDAAAQIASVLRLGAPVVEPVAPAAPVVRTAPKP